MDRYKVDNTATVRSNHRAEIQCRYADSRDVSKLRAPMSMTTSFCSPSGKPIIIIIIVYYAEAAVQSEYSTISSYISDNYSVKQ